jgi:hypothetical protein
VTQSPTSSLPPGTARVRIAKSCRTSCSSGASATARTGAGDETAASLAFLLADPARVAEVPSEQVAPLLCQLATLQVLLAARLAVPAPNGDTPDEVLTDVAEVARIVRHSPSWVRKNGHRLPGFAQPGGKRTQVSWSRRALEPG